MFAALLFLSTQLTFALEPKLETTWTTDGLRLAIKHFENPGKIPLILIHGLGTNDREWDLKAPHPSFAKRLHAEGYDVWVANLRGFGTPGFESEAPASNSWTIDDYAALDLPAIVAKVQRSTGQRPWLLGHSLGVHSIEGYLDGLVMGSFAYQDPQVAQERKENLRGIVMLAGVHNLWWPKSLGNIRHDPVLSWQDYFDSNYELELLASSDWFYRIATLWDQFNLAGVQKWADLGFDGLPLIGRPMDRLYDGILRGVADNPFMNIFYYTPNTDPSVIISVGSDGTENVPTMVLEQLGNAIQNQRTTTHFHLRPKAPIFAYGSYRKTWDRPVLLVAGDKDRLTNAQMIYRDGYLENGSSDKEFVLLKDTGHFDIMVGENSEAGMQRAVIDFLRRY